MSKKLQASIDGENFFDCPHTFTGIGGDVSVSSRFAHTNRLGVSGVTSKTVNVPPAPIDWSNVEPVNTWSKSDIVTNSVNDIKVDSNENVAYIASSDKTLTKMDKEGNVIWQVTGERANMSIAVGLDGFVYVGGWGGSILKHSPIDGSVVQSIGPSVISRCLYIDDDGSLYSGQMDTNQVSKYDNAGNWVWSVSNLQAGGSGVFSVAVDSQKNTYIGMYGGSSARAFGKISSTGVVLYQEYGAVTCMDIEIGENDSVYRIYPGTAGVAGLVKCDNQNKLLWVYNSPTGKLATHIAIDSLGYVYLTCSGTVIKFNQSGDIIWSIVINDKCVGVDSDMNVYAGGQSSHIRRISQVPK